MSSNPVTIDIVSDIVCPWCWLGKKHLDTAIANAPVHDISINWRPFMLDPDVPAEGVPYADYMRAKFGDGPSDKFKSMRKHLETAAPDLGIHFQFDGIPTRPNTLKAHCLMKWAAGQGKSHAMAERLFRAFFDEHQDVGDIKILSGIAGETGMDADLVLELLQDQRDVDQVQSELMYFRRLGVSGVPFFIYNGTFSVQGGQPAEVHEQALEKAAALPPKDVMRIITD